ncbi:MAG: hypothetical protein KY441_00665 [Actinobacteria bacterium]|nr:hypothetical protein [Actinomycetota bacterium]
MVLGVVVARSVSLEHFGAFSAVYLTYILLGLLSRAASSEVLIVRYSASPPSEQRQGVQASVGTALLTGFVGAAICVAVALLTGGVLRSGFLVLALCMPGLFLQDAWRFAFFVQGRPAAAATNDLLWAVVQFSALAAVAAVAEVSVVTAILAWGVGAYACSAIGALQARALPAPGQARWWWRSHRDLIPRFVAEYAVGRGSGQLSFFLIAAVTSLAAFGALRAANLLLGPLNVLFASVAVVAVPEAVRLYRRAPARVWNLCLVSAAAMAGVAVLAGGALMVLPDAIGQSFLGDSWPGARQVVLPLSLAAAALATQMASLIGLRAMALARRSLNARLAVAPVRLGFATGGAVLGGAVGAAWGLAAAEIAGAIVHWRQLAMGSAQDLAASSESPRDARAAADVSAASGTAVTASTKGAEGAGMGVSL